MINTNSLVVQKHVCEKAFFLKSSFANFSITQKSSFDAFLRIKIIVLVQICGRARPRIKEHNPIHEKNGRISYANFTGNSNSLKPNNMRVSRKDICKEIQMRHKFSGTIPCLALGAQITPTPLFLIFFNLTFFQHKNKKKLKMENKERGGNFLCSKSIIRDSAYF